MNRSNQELENVNLSTHEDSVEQFVVKRTELADIMYFTEDMNNITRAYNKFFDTSDLQMIYETSLFSITVVDQRSNNYAGLFIFNDTPFSNIRKEGYPNVGGIWEEWFSKYYDEVKLDGKNSLWLMYFCLNEIYVSNEELQKKIYHKVHLSLYTTLSMVNGVFILLPKALNNEMIENVNNVDDSAVPLYSVKVLTGYMFDLLNEIDEDSNTNNLVVYLNRRITVFPLIEIRVGTQEDHDDLENIFKDQTPPEIVSCYEDFFIAKMIADQSENSMVLVGQVNDKAIGMLAISTDVNVPLLVKSFELENYDNLLKQDYMKAVKLKRKLITSAKENMVKQDHKDLLKRYKQEIMSTERISQRIYLQEFIIKNPQYIDRIEEIAKEYPNKEAMDEKFAETLIKTLLEDFKLRKPNLEPFEGKVKMDEGSCLLADEFEFFIETLEFFGLQERYMMKEGHWSDWLKKEAERQAQREMFRKKLGQENKGKKAHRNAKKNNEETAPAYFDFSPLINAMKLFKEANLTARSSIRKVISENKHLISSFFVNEDGDPSETKCFDVMGLKKKLIQSKVSFPIEFGDLIGPILLCFGSLPFEKRIVMRVPEEEEEKASEKKEVKKKPKKTDKKKEVKEEEEKKVEIKPVPVTLYEVSLSEFLSSIEISFNYDKLIFEIGDISSDLFKEEYNSYILITEEDEKKNMYKEKTEYQAIKEEKFKINIKDSEEQLSIYSELLENYDDEKDVPPTPSLVLNAFCVKLFFIEQAFESRSSDFLLQAFDCFPDKDYLIITQPHSYYENSLLDNFIKIEKKLDSLFNDMLYIVHRESLMISLLKVQHATEEDLIRSSYLFDQLSEEADYMFKLSKEAIRNPKSKFQCITAKINEHNIGLVLISKEANIAYYDSHFNIRDYSNIDKISKYFHGRIIYYTVNKNFQQFTKIIMKEITRLTNKISIYFELYPNIKTCPQFFKDLLLLRNRRFPHFTMKKSENDKELYEDEKIKTRTDGEERDDYDELESDFCLVMSTKKMFGDAKIANNNRIVVVGGSDTGISFIESLLSIRYLEFTYIYLIAPGGLLYHHISDEINNLKISFNNYQINELKKLLLEHRIKIIDSKVIDIKPVQKYVQLEDYTVLNYDFLILTLGLQDKLWSELKTVVTNQLDTKQNEIKSALQNNNNNNNPNQKDLNNLNNAFLNLHQQMKVISIDDPTLYTLFSPESKMISSLRKNPKFEIILYGRSLNLMCFIQGLIRRGVPPKKIKWVIPNIQAHAAIRDDKGNFKKDLSILEEVTFTNSNQLENSSDVEMYLLSNLIKQDVTIIQNYYFAGVNLNGDMENNIFPDTILSYKFIEEGNLSEVKDISANMIITGGLIDVDQIVFRFIHDNKLVYNGRAIIKQNFMTANDSIFAAGRLCEFSQKFYYTEKGKLLKLESYNSREVGYSLAKSFLQTIDSQLSVDNSIQNDNKLPTFYLPLPMGCYLPNNLLFFNVKSVKETNPKVLEKGNNRQPLIFDNLTKSTDNKGCYLKFTFNAFGIIDSIMYLGSLKISYHSIVSLVGLHENYLNELLDRYETKLVEDIPDFLSENWAMALYHDNFTKLVIKLKDIIQDKDEIDNIHEMINTVMNNNLSLDRNTLKNMIKNISEATQKKIELEILNFLYENKNHLPFYHIPTVKDI